MTNKLTIVQFDNDEHALDTVDLVLFSWEMSLSGRAYDAPTAKDLLAKIESKQIVPDIALVDAFISNAEDEGEKIATILRKANPKIKIIGYSTYETDKWSDEHVGKGQFKNDNKLPDILAQFLGEPYHYDNAKLPVNQEPTQAKYSKFQREFTE